MGLYCTCLLKPCYAFEALVKKHKSNKINNQTFLIGNILHFVVHDFQRINLKVMFRCIFFTGV